MSYQVMMFCQVDANELAVFGERVCAKAASQFEGVAYSGVSADRDLRTYRFETTSGQEMYVEFHRGGMLFDYATAMASRDPDAGPAPSATCIINFNLVGDTPMQLLYKIWENVSSSNSAVLHDEMDGFAAEIGHP